MWVGKVNTFVQDIYGNRNSLIKVKSITVTINEWVVFDIMRDVRKESIQVVWGRVYLSLAEMEENILKDNTVAYLTRWAWEDGVEI